jgi:hypothetical protein
MAAGGRASWTRTVAQAVVGALIVSDLQDKLMSNEWMVELLKGAISMMTMI